MVVRKTRIHCSNKGYAQFISFTGNLSVVVRLFFNSHPPIFTVFHSRAQGEDVAELREGRVLWLPAVFLCHHEVGQVTTEREA